MQKDCPQTILLHFLHVICFAAFLSKSEAGFILSYSAGGQEEISFHLPCRTALLNFFVAMPSNIRNKYIKS